MSILIATPVMALTFGYWRDLDGIKLAFYAAS